MNPHAVEIIQAIGGEVLPAFSTPRLVFATATEEQYEDLVGRISIKSSNCFGDTDVNVVQVFDFDINDDEDDINGTTIFEIGFIFPEQMESFKNYWPTWIGQCATIKAYFDIAPSVTGVLPNPPHFLTDHFWCKFNESELTTGMMHAILRNRYVFEKLASKLIYIDPAYVMSVSPRGYKVPLEWFTDFTVLVLFAICDLVEPGDKITIKHPSHYAIKLIDRHIDCPRLRAFFIPSLVKSMLGSLCYRDEDEFYATRQVFLSCPLVHVTFSTRTQAYTIG